MAHVGSWTLWLLWPSGFLISEIGFHILWLMYLFKCQKCKFTYSNLKNAGNLLSRPGLPWIYLHSRPDPCYIASVTDLTRPVSWSLNPYPTRPDLNLALPPPSMHQISTRSEHVQHAGVDRARHCSRRKQGAADGGSNVNANKYKTYTKFKTLQSFWKRFTRTLHAYVYMDTRANTLVFKKSSVTVTVWHCTWIVLIPLSHVLFQ
jgi:hypothetical protein